MPGLPSLAVVIKIPAEAVVPLLVGTGALLVLLFAGAKLKDWKDSHPAAAAKTGMVVAVLFSAFALWVAVRVVPAHWIDFGKPGDAKIGFLDGPIMGFSALMGTIFWRFANQRQIALGFGLLIGLALATKPFIFPLHTYYAFGSETPHERVWSLMDPEHLSVFGPGIAVVIAALIAGKRPRS
jgi:hypothetical protein